MPFYRTFALLLAATVAAVAVAAPAPAAPAYQQAVRITFPTNAGATYRDDFHASRGGGTRVHRATDLFGPMGWPVFAAAAGRVVWLPDWEQSSAGWAVQIRDTRGRTFAYYHLGPAGGSKGRAIARGLSLGDSVRRGQVIGYLGDSGNAAGGTPHLHFEIHDPRIRDPYGSDRINPVHSLRAAERAGRYASGSVRPSRGSRNEALRVGSRGPAVRRWQRQLNRVRHAGLPVTGYFGPLTHRATVRFQRSKGLGPAGFGTVGPQTREAMRVALARHAAPPKPNRPNLKPKPRARAGVLREGSRGTRVERWQTKLNRLSRTDLPVTGYFGPLTRAATASFQRRHGMGPPGIGTVGPRTAKAMAAALAERRKPAPAPRQRAAAPQLRQGSRGPAVTVWQRQLRRVGARGLPVTGYFGPLTHGATVRFQRRAGLGDSGGLGIVGPLTRAAMRRALR